MRSRSRLPRGVLVATGPVVLVAAGIVGYLSFGYSPWTAVAMTLLTLTTVGLAWRSPQDPRWPAAACRSCAGRRCHC